MVSTFRDALEKADQRVEYVQVDGAGHAFFDLEAKRRNAGHVCQVRRPACRENEGVFCFRSVFASVIRLKHLDTFSHIGASVCLELARLMLARRNTCYSCIFSRPRWNKASPE